MVLSLIQRDFSKSTIIMNFFVFYALFFPFILEVMWLENLNVVYSWWTFTIMKYFSFLLVFFSFLYSLKEINV